MEKSMRELMDHTHNAFVRYFEKLPKGYTGEEDKNLQLL